jgi:serine/threonine-protein kinase
MSRVFVATERALTRRVVIKVLPPELAAGVNTERFRREIQLSAQLNHPHIVPVLAAGEIGEMLYYTMPFIEGESLNQRVAKSGRMDAREVLRVLHDVVDAIAYAHSRGVIHRDIKPANILAQGNHALVTDFGVAKAISVSLPTTGITSGGFAIGTPAYMAPEQLAADPNADHRIDIYAVGLLAYELFTGESPFAATSPQATMAAQLTRVPSPLHRIRPDIPHAISDMVQRCLEKLPENRPATAQVLLAELDAISTPQGDVRAPGPTLRTILTYPRRYVSQAVMLAAATAVLAFAIFRVSAIMVRNEKNVRSAQAATVAGAGTVSDTELRSRDRDAMNALLITPQADAAADSAQIAALVSQLLAGSADSLRSKLLADFRRDSAAITDSIRDAIEREVLDSLARMRAAAQRSFAERQQSGGRSGSGARGPADLRRPLAPGERRVLITDFVVRLGRADSSGLSVTLADSLSAALARTGNYRPVSQRAATEASGSNDPRVMVDAVRAAAVLMGSVSARRRDSVVVRLFLSEPARTQQPRPVASIALPIASVTSGIDSLLPLAMEQLRRVNWPAGRSGRRGGGGGGAGQAIQGNSRGGRVPPPSPDSVRRGGGGGGGGTELQDRG